MGRLIRASLLLAVVLLGALVPGVSAASPFATFGTPTATGPFGSDMVFRQPLTVTSPIGRAELLLTFADAIGPTVIDVPPPGGTGAVNLDYTLAVADSGHVLPNTPIKAEWRVTSTADPATPETGPEITHVYADERFDWQTKQGKIVRVHWYDGDSAFGQRALEVGERGVENAAKLLGVTETEPVDFFIYADQQAFYDALGPGTRENVGGQADSDIRTLFALIPPSQIDDAWVDAVIPHELTHLVFNTAVKNPYHFPPRWLNEGLAVYESEGFGSADRRDVEAAAKDGALIPLPGLTGQFPTTADRFRLAYSESVSAVDYLVRTYGNDVLVGLIKSYADGRTDDEAFQAAVGQTMSQFSDAWLADYGAAVPPKTGPQDPPAGPVPSSWAQGSAQPAATSGPGASAAVPVPSSATSPTPIPVAPSSDASGTVLVVVLIGIVLVGGGIFLARRRRTASL